MAKIRGFLGRILGGIFMSNVATPGGLVLGPQYKSTTIINMSEAPVVDAVKSAIPDIQRAIELIRDLKSDDALPLLEESLRTLMQGMPPETEIVNANQ